MHLRDRTQDTRPLLTTQVSPPLTTPRKGAQWDNSCFHCSRHPSGQSAAAFSTVHTEEHPKRQSRVNCPSLGGGPSLEGDKSKKFPVRGEFSKCTGKARGPGSPSRLPAVLLYHFLCSCPMGGTSPAKGCVSACLNTALKPFSGTL